MVGSLLNQVSADIRGRIMIKLMIIMMIFFWILCFKISPSLKFYLLLLIFSLDYLRASSSFWHNSTHLRSISSIIPSGTFLFCKGWILKVCYILSTMLLMSKTLPRSVLFLLLKLSESLMSLDLFLPKRTGTWRTLSLL